MKRLTCKTKGLEKKVFLARLVLKQKVVTFPQCAERHRFTKTTHGVLLSVFFAIQFT